MELLLALDRTVMDCTLLSADETDRVVDFSTISFLDSTLCEAFHWR